MQEHMHDETKRSHILIVLDEHGSWSQHPGMSTEQALMVLEAIAADYRNELTDNHLVSVAQENIREWSDEV